jgi:DNA helicase-2/ATP-dependent DNA helicase PcrA
MHPQHILERLNPAQQEAVSTEARHALVLAGAGSGKTRVLVHRMAWLLAAEGVSPWSILAVTFTNKAAAEMRNRIAHMLNQPVQNLWIGTFHGIALRLLSRHHEQAELPQNFQILDSEDQYRLIRRVLADLELDEKQWPPRQVQGYINNNKNEGLRPAEIDHFGDDMARQWIRIYEAYDERMQRAGAVDFAEMLLRAHELLLKNPDILEHYRQRFKHILVDEFQDTNSIQSAFIRLLAGDRNSVMVVGDDDQSIYAWRGARVDHILNFTRHFPEAKSYRLEQNYRSTATILEAANAIIANNSQRLGKELWTAGETGEKIQLYGAYSEYDEAAFVADEIEKAIENGYAPDQIAVLYRSNAQSRLIEESLLKRGIAYRVYGGLRFFERLEIKDVLAYARLVNNRHDDVAFERVINTPTRGLGQKTLDHIRSVAAYERISLWDASLLLLQQKKLTARAAAALAGFVNLIDELQQDGSSATDKDSGEAPLDQLLTNIVERTGLKDHYLKEPPEKSITRLENIDELINAAENFSKPEEDELAGLSTLASFLAQVSLDAGDQADKDQPAVQLMTLHSAKGLEFPLVFLIGMEQGLFPHQRSMEEPDKLAEERRLCYVGITRAEKKLFMTYATSRRLHGKTTHARPSQFLREIPEKLVEQIAGNVYARPGGGFDQWSNSASGASQPGHGASHSGGGQTTHLPEFARFNLGDSVSHPVFGEGVVMEMTGNGDHIQIAVAFKDFGTKVLAAKFAKLTRL